MASDFMKDLVSDAMVKAGLEQPAPQKDYSEETAVDTLLHTIPVAGPLMASGLNFTQGLLGGQDYRDQQEAMEASQQKMLDDTGLGHIPYTDKITTMAHGAGDAGAYIGDVMGWMLD